MAGSKEMSTEMNIALKQTADKVAAARFPSRYYDLHPDIGLNFQLNRMYNWVGEDRMLEELRDVAPKIHDYSDWTREFLKLGEETISQGRNLTGAYYLRLAEFFMFTSDPLKKPTRDRFLELVLAAHGLSLQDRQLVPFENGFLPAYRFTPANPKSTIVMFGGFDSYIEEWLPMFEYLRDAGYDVVAFDGPGQGGALEEFHLTMTPDWHKPVGVVLDHFGLKDVTLMGLSLGGCLVVRAAAFEKRVKRVVADDILTNFTEGLMRQVGGAAKHLPITLLAQVFPHLVDDAVARRGKRSLMLDWGFKQAMHVLGADSPHDCFKAIAAYRTDDVSAKIDQDVLLLCGAEDHYVPVHQLADQVRSLTNVRSLATRFFTRAEQAQNHCQIGNIGLSLRVVTSWLETLEI
jgi:pimeloyl-ACP methyl ester carboxylesterase